MVVNKPHPQYKVSWVWNKVCKACKEVHKEMYTWGFFTPEKALDQAVSIRNNPEYILLSVDQ